MTELLDQIQSAQVELDPQFKALRGATSVLNRAAKLAGEEKLDPLAMHKLLAKLEEAGNLLPNESLQAAIRAFAAATQTGLDGLAFDFARDLKESFEARGLTVEGRPPTLVVGELALTIDMAARKAQWLYGKEALTNPIPLSISGILKAYDAQYRAILQRTLDIPAFLAEMMRAWQELLDEKSAKAGRRVPGNRLNLVEVYSRMVMNRQSGRFWNQPSRSTFKDYARAHFVRDVVLAQAAPTIVVEGKSLRLRLGGATKSQADNASRSVWLPQSALDGDYYADIIFEEV